VVRKTASAVTEQQQQQQPQSLLLRTFDAVECSDVGGLHRTLLLVGGDGEGTPQDVGSVNVNNVDVINAVHPFDDTRPTLLHWACARNCVSCVRLLLQLQADASQMDHWGFTALHNVSFQWNPHWNHAVRKARQCDERSVGTSSRLSGVQLC